MSGNGKLTGRKVALFAVMAGALALTVNGEVQAVAPMLGTGFGAVLAAVFALSTLLALNYVIEGTGSVRLWAWLVLVLAGGMELGLNTWHALSAVLTTPEGAVVLDSRGRAVPALPPLAAVAVGAGPVLLAGLLSHLVALTMADRPAPVPPAAPTPAPAPALPVPGTGLAAREESGAGDPVPVRASATRVGVSAGTGTGARGRKPRAVEAGTRTAPKTPRPDDELLAVLTYPELVARDADGTVPVRRAARELGCGVDRARKLLRESGLLADRAEGSATEDARSELVDAAV
ncbi:hypothetical protein [Actinokineospora iranica]|uniref:Uncharacterized protein n=1 Tax=Actinokineospora iranica TaxID=1271860 RepID=A0A1G6YYW2_9PSEU|nr:hypothetical protein [Actinokineospora iranica]SDD94835.1 hypothetical protein SAMN05216174_12416 [Actinokineospora iranica]